MNFNFPTDNLYKFITLIGLTLLSYGLLSENKYTDLLYEKSSEINALWKDARILDYEYTNLNKKNNDSLMAEYSETAIYKMNVINKEMEFLVSDLEKLTELEKNLANRNWWFNLSGLIITIIGLILWYHKTQKNLDNAV